MNKIVIALVVLLAISAFAADTRKDFMSFMRRHNKIYGHDEFPRRYRIFSENLKIAERLNNEHEHATFGVTKFMDMTPEEFEYHYLRKIGDLPKYDNVAPRTNVMAPSSYSWRDKGAVTKVKNQGQCGSCWSFSTTGNVEGQWFLAGHDLVSLSEQNLVDCDTMDSGCDGGLPSNAYQYIISNNGIDKEECYPYVAYDQDCQFDSSCVGAKISSWESVSQDEGEIASYLYKNGPLSVALNANFLQFYTGGVADPSDCDPQGIDHGVLLTGYGNAEGKDYWEVKNSWGADWGEEGYFRLVRGKGKCGINLVVTCSKV